MAFDWTTFGLEIINFLALLWILKRFLYRPVLALSLIHISEPTRPY